MQITNNLSCCKPRRRMDFRGHENSSREISKMRYKHFEQMDDDILTLHSIAKAYKDVRKSGKMQILKAIPMISAAVIGTSLAISQPGKLSAKATMGLGFLALVKGFEKVSDLTDETIGVKPTFKNTLARFIVSLGATMGLAGAAIGLYKGGKNVLGNISPKTANFLKSEGQTLINEINNSKLGKFVENSVNPFVQKHQGKFNALCDVIPFVSAFGGIYAQEKLGQKISNRVAQKAQENFENAKQIQQIARDNFDKIEAQEV